MAAYQRQASRRSELDRQDEGREKTGVWLGASAVNPVNGRELPVFIADYVLTGYGTGAIMAVPGEDTRDWEFAEVFGLPVVRTVQPPADWDGGAYTGVGPMINSSNDEISLDGLEKPEAIAAITRWLVARGAGEATVTYKLRDWLFSRQRYWGEPFPIVYPVDGPDAGLPRAVPDSALPVLLPEVDDYSPKTFPDDDADSVPEPPLSRATEWTTVTLDLGDGPREYRRETNTMPNWAGSCWYYLRYLDPHDDERFVDPELERYWMGPRGEGDVGGVDLYVGGVEHAVLHLLYARFWHKVLFDLGYVSSEEPFRRLVNQGYISAYAYTDERGFYVPAAEVRGEGRPVLPRGQPGQPRVRQDRQEPEEHGHAGRDHRLLRRGHLPGLRDVDRAAGAVPAVGDAGRRRLAAAAAADLAGRRRRGDRRGPRGRRRARRGDAARAAPHDRRRPRRAWPRCGSTSRSPASPS